MRYTDKIRDNDKKIRTIGADKFVPRNDLRGKRFGRLLVLDFDHKGGSSGRKYYYKCRCDCGDEVVKSTAYLLHADLYPHQSCGCWHKEINIATSTTHGHGSRTNATYKTWIEMKLRCENPNNSVYSDYGGRGIKVCDRWRNSFETFLADMGERPSRDYSIDRINVNGDYEPSNCRWATRKEQCNNRRSNINIEYNGEVRTLTEWCEILNMNFSNVWYQLRKKKNPLPFADIVRIYKNGGYKRPPTK